MYHVTPDEAGIRQAIANRQARPVNRKLLYEVISGQYQGKASAAQQAGIDALLDDHTFTICTAHQPNIFTGYLYFIYKILHVVRIAESLKASMPQYQFVPVYYMGSEDNDLDELGQVKVDGVKLVWQTKQEGAVGRMKVDQPLLQLIAQLEGQLGVLPQGPALIHVLRSCYREGISMAEATQALVDQLFQTYGLLVLNADDARLKAVMKPVFANDLVQHDAYRLVTETGAAMESRYKVQVNPREINLFYMINGLRERIIEKDGYYTTESGAIHMNREEVLQLLDEHPECFSPNVVLRALYQETILPNIAFVGGGSEIAYWLELGAMFSHFGMTLPALVLRNSFLIAQEKDEQKLKEAGMSIEELFAGDFQMVDAYVKKHSTQTLHLHEEQAMADTMFRSLKEKAAAVDRTLMQHVEALQAKLNKQLENAEKKLVRAEKRKFTVEQEQLIKLRARLFPGGSLQERVDNFMPYYGVYGEEFISTIHRHSLALEQQFTVITYHQ